MVCAILSIKRIYGVRNGSANPKGTEVGVSTANGGTQTQEDLAKKFGVSVDTLQRAKP